MVRLLGVEVGIERLSRRQLGGGPAHGQLREPVALIVGALLNGATVEAARLALGFVLRDPVLDVGQVVEVRQREAGALGKL